jgi:hypothetical protein
MDLIATCGRRVVSPDGISQRARREINSSSDVFGNAADRLSVLC